MTVGAKTYRCVLGLGLATLACGGDGGTPPPGPPARIVKSGGDAQQWYFNNPLPNPYEITVLDANDRAVPGVSVDWTILTGGGTLSADPSTTNSNGVATTIHTLGSATTYVVTATVSAVPPTTFTATASAPPTAVGVTVKDNVFDKADAVVQVNGSVTWTWAGANQHSVTFGTGAPSSPTQASGTYSRQFTTTGTFDYHCVVHAGMTGTVTVVN